MASAFGAGTASAITLVANIENNNGGSANWGIFFDLTATGRAMSLGLAGLALRFRKG